MGAGTLHVYDGTVRDLRADRGADLPNPIQMSCLDKNLPPEIRLNFVKKVYGLVGLMLLVTFCLAAPFVFATEEALSWMDKHSWVKHTALVILLFQHAFNTCMMLQMCCGGSSLFACYMKMMITVPWNYLYLFTYAVCFGLVVGVICAGYTAESVVLVFFAALLLIIGLTVYAVRTKADFTGCGAYILVLIMGLLLLLLLGISIPVGNMVFRIIGCLGSIIFGFIIVYDTQLIFGSDSFGGGKRKFEYTIDMYAFASWNLYLDFINFFLYLLHFLGQRR